MKLGYRMLVCMLTLSGLKRGRGKINANRPSHARVHAGLEGTEAGKRKNKYR